MAKPTENNAIDRLERLLMKSKRPTDLEKRIVDFFHRHKNPPDRLVHNLAARLGVAPDEIETAIYKLLSSLFTAGRSAKQAVTPDPAQLAMGETVEREHTDNPYIARKIALDHLAEDPSYYSKLKRMEEGKC